VNRDGAGRVANTSMSDRSFARIVATGCYLPPQVITNRELIERFELDVDEAWIESRTGIVSRHWMSEDQTTSDMLVECARSILAQAGLEARDVDRLIVSTVSPDHPSPSTATIVARKLGARCAAFDLSAACAGFLYGLDLARGALATGAERVLVLAADARSRYIDRCDRRGVVLFADGAAGALVSRSSEPGLVEVCIGAEGLEHMGAWIPAGGAARPTTRETVERGEHFLQVDGFREIFERFKGFTREAVHNVLERAGVELGDVDLFITHQGNAFLVREIVADLGIDPARAVEDVARHGNTSGATVPIALAEARASGRIKSGDLVLLASVGAGWTFGAALHRF
jgi:3-oxoacyl-[acyl-carrier-protein] synthase-3